MRFSSLAATLCILLVNAVVDAESPAVRVMSFNIRYGTAKDGENHWDRRKMFLVETIRHFDPDLLGTQETLDFQRDFLAEQFSGYGVTGVGRDDGKNGGEMMALYYRKARFELLEQGHFWLSETPDKIGSKSWDSSLPRMVTWVKLRDRQKPSGPPILFLNTHFDHRGEQARRESAKLIRRRLESEEQSHAIILTGDFNTDESSEPYNGLFQMVENLAAPIRDTFREAHPEKSGNEGTFSNFKASETAGPRIDWIGVSSHWKIIEARIDRTEREGRTPSDHFPITAILEPR